MLSKWSQIPLSNNSGFNPTAKIACEALLNFLVVSFARLIRIVFMSLARAQAESAKAAKLQLENTQLAADMKEAENQV